MMMIFRSAFLAILCIASFSAVAAEPDAASSGKVVYAPSNLENVSNVLFRKGILRADDPAAVEEYIRIHECGLYEQYGRNDFSWSRIREAQSRDLEVHFKNLPEGLEISSTISVEPFDMTNNEFPIIAHDRLSNSGLITVFREQTGSIRPCKSDRYNAFVPRVHPLEVIAKIDQPITIATIPMKRADADALVNIMNARTNVGSTDRRKVQLVLRIRVTGSDPLSNAGSVLKRNVLATIDDLRIYEGPERKMLLFRKDYESLRASAGKK